MQDILGIHPILLRQAIVGIIDKTAQGWLKSNGRRFAALVLHRLRSTANHGASDLDSMADAAEHDGHR